MYTTEKDSGGAFTYHIADPEDWTEIDAQGTAFFNGGMVTVNGAQELADTLVESGQMEWCWSREYFRFTVGRVETNADASSIESIAESLRNGATLNDGFKAIAHTPQFKTLYKPIPSNYTEDTP